MLTSKSPNLIFSPGQEGLETHAETETEAEKLVERRPEGRRGRVIRTLTEVHTQ